MPMPLYIEEAKCGNTVCPLTIGKGADSPYGCIGKICGAWRFARTHIKNPAAPEGDLIPSDDTYGFCGLAGVPGIAS